ncbi:MAG: trigger factor [Raineya sp.]
MESVFVKNSSTLGELSVKITPEDYLPVFEKELKKIASKAQIKGFRQGKTPVSVVRNMYGKAILADEINKLLSKSIDSYIEENNIAYLGELIPLNNEEIDFDLKSPNTYNFKFQIATAAPFDLQLANVVVKQYQPTINEEEMEKNIQQNAERFAKEEEVESIIDNACLLIGEAVWQEESQEGEEPTWGRQNCYLPLKELLPEKLNTIIGAKVGDTISIVPSQDIDLGEEDKSIGYILGIFDSEQIQKLKDKNVQITIKTILHKQARAYDKELFEEIFPGENIENLEQFREKITNLEQANLTDEFSYFNESLFIDAVLESHQFDLPDEFLKDWMLRKNPKLTKEQVEKEYPIASKEIRWGVIRRKILKENNIKVEQSEINNYATNLIVGRLRQYGLLNSPEFSKSIPNIVKNYLSADGGKNLEKIYDAILNEKVINTIKEKVQLETIKLHWKEVEEAAKKYFEKEEQLLDNSEAKA